MLVHVDDLALAIKGKNRCSYIYPIFIKAVDLFNYVSVVHELIVVIKFQVALLRFLLIVVDLSQRAVGVIAIDRFATWLIGAGREQKAFFQPQLFCCLASAQADNSSFPDLGLCKGYLVGYSPFGEF